MARLISVMLLLAGMAPTGAQAQAMQWESCSNRKFQAWFAEPVPKSLRCGYLDVPLKYDDAGAPKGGKTVRLALTRLPATGVRQGSMLVISGGPGESGIQPFPDTGGALARLRKSWDIVGYDARGVGQSRPRIDCRLPAKASKLKLKLDQEQEDRMLFDACVANTGVEVLQHIGTHEAVNDVDRIRQALGEDKLTAVGYSYGTQVAALYAERFPARTRALVLDGVVDLEEAKDDFAWQLNQARAYQHSFERFAAWCARTGRCQLAADKETANTQFRALLRKLDAKPLHDARGQRITPDDVVALTTDLLLSRSSWPILATMVRELGVGPVSRKVKRLFDQPMQDESDALRVINCVDQSSRKRSKEDVLARRKQIRDAFEAANYQPEKPVLQDLCDFWPWKNDVHAKRPAQVGELPQLLFVAQRHDPTTPWANARNMASLFRSPLLTVEGDGHTLVFSGENRCADQAAVDYLMDPAKQRTDTSCRVK